MSWSAADRADLARRGISIEEADRQLALLREPPAPARLARPATVGDGVERIAPHRAEELIALGEAARDAGRLTKLVPASGAATRMFKSLVAVRERLPRATAAELRAHGDDPDAVATAAFVDALPQLALARRLAAALDLTLDELLDRARTEPLAPILDRLLERDGLNALALPKALLPFHERPGERGSESADAAETVTALEEQLDEGLHYLGGPGAPARYAFTIPAGARAEFEAALDRWRAKHPERRIEVALSEQSPATDTLALERNGEPARTPDGGLFFRPAGHGALVANLEASGGDILLVKNIDNVLPSERHAEIARARLLLAGRLVELERESEKTGRARPLRVAGVVPNAGEPGGGPFWVLGADGAESLQIVESSQVALGDPEQAAIWRASTHFNPVDLACSLRDARGEPFALASFVDPATSFVSVKSEGGRELRVLERPGLWNGAMAGWTTRFVELPAWTFAPVKSVVDLARPEHAARREQR